MIWDIINSLGRLILTVLATGIVMFVPEELSHSERAGLALTGSGSFLTIGVIWEGHDSPFDGWATTIITYGMVLFLWGYGTRKIDHWRRNTAQRRAARLHFGSKGKP